MSDEEQIGYAEAMRELEEILDALEDDDLDVDVLAAKVERASALIQLAATASGTLASRSRRWSPHSMSRPRESTRSSTTATNEQRPSPTH